MVRVAVASVVISIAVMIVAVCVVTGFQKEITSKVVGFSSHIQLVNYDNNTSYETAPINRDLPFLNEIMALKDVISVEPYAIKAGVMKSSEGIQGVVLKGIDSLSDISFFEKSLKEGAIPSYKGERGKEVLISKTLADMMKLKLGDKFEMTFIQEPPRRDRFSIAGIFDTSLPEFDKATVICDIRNVQRLNGWGESMITGYEITGSDFDKISSTRENVEKIVFENGEDIMVTDTKEKYIFIFDWLKLQDVNVAIIITIMIIVSGFNMIAMMLILLIERTAMIGVLSSLGMGNRSIQKMFVIRSSFIVLRGILIGNIVGISMVLIQKYTGVVKLSESGYFLSVVPIHINWIYIIMISLVAFVLIVVIQAIPTFIISKISPQKSIKYDTRA